MVSSLQSATCGNNKETFISLSVLKRIYGLHVITDDSVWRGQRRGKEPLGKHGLTLEDSVKMNDRKLGCEIVNYIGVVQD